MTDVRAVFQLRIFRARNPYECAFCQSPIAKGQYYYRDDPHPMARYRRGQTARQICIRCVEGDVYLREERETNQLELPFDKPLIQPVRVELIDVTDALLERLRVDPDELNRVSAAQLQQFACERLSAMGFEARQTGNINRKDGGIDIVFWNHGPFPMLGAAQVKHHQNQNAPTGSDVIRDFRGALAVYPFQLGVVITNTTFTADARWFAENQQGLIRLRDGEDLRKWIKDEFATDELWRAVPRQLTLCPGVVIDVPILR
jgi:hypothetical protein